METKSVETKGIISWFNRGGSVFGYIESSCGKEVYFDADSLVPLEYEEISVGDVVQFLIEKNEFGEVARQIRKMQKIRRRLFKK